MHSRIHADQRQFRHDAAARRWPGCDAACVDLPAVQPDAGYWLRGGNGQSAAFHRAGLPLRAAAIRERPGSAAMIALLRRAGVARVPLSLYNLLFFTFLVAPIVVVVAASFTAGNPITVPFHGRSLPWYRRPLHFPPLF